LTNLQISFSLNPCIWVDGPTGPGWRSGLRQVDLNGISAIHPGSSLGQPTPRPQGVTSRSSTSSHSVEGCGTFWSWPATSQDDPLGITDLHDIING